jgi:hypothetical protein
LNHAIAAWFKNVSKWVTRLSDGFGKHCCKGLGQLASIAA